MGAWCRIVAGVRCLSSAGIGVTCVRYRIGAGVLCESAGDVGCNAAGGVRRGTVVEVRCWVGAGADVWRWAGADNG